jgi:uncharacterized damage-inducible protein DinB
MPREIVEQYAHGADKLRQAIADMGEEELKAVPIPGKLSTQKVVIHLADAETAFADRIRRVLAQDNPVLMAWDENKFIARLNYDEQSAMEAVQIIDLTRRQLARVLRKKTDADLSRAGEHNERGRQTVLDILKAANSHLDHHLKFIEEKRAVLHGGASRGGAAGLS